MRIMRTKRAYLFDLETTKLVTRTVDQANDVATENIQDLRDGDLKPRVFFGCLTGTFLEHQNYAIYVLNELLEHGYSTKADRMELKKQIAIIQISIAQHLERIEDGQYEAVPV